MKFEFAKRVANSERRRCLARAITGVALLFCNCTKPPRHPSFGGRLPGGAGLNIQQGRRAGTDKI